MNSVVKKISISIGVIFIITVIVLLLLRQNTNSNMLLSVLSLLGILMVLVHYIGGKRNNIL